MLTDKSSRIAVLGLLAGFMGFAVSVAGFCGESPKSNHKPPARNENLRAMPAKILTASWYSRESLVKEGTWKDGKERMMANGQKCDDKQNTCATRLYSLGKILLVTNRENGRSIQVTVSDRVGKRFATTRIDLSKGAFSQIADLNQGLAKVTVEVIDGTRKHPAL